MIRFFVFFILLCFSARAVERDPNAVLDAYDAKLAKLKAAFSKRADELKKDAVVKLLALKKSLARKGDIDGAKAVGDLIDRLNDEVLVVKKVALDDALSDDIGGVPPPPDDASSVSPLTKEQLEAGRKVKTRKITKPKELRKALEALNPAYNNEEANFELEDGKIVKVDLSNAGIVNISPLAGLKYVRNICLNSNPIWNLKPLAKLHLNVLSLANTDVRDLTPLKKMKLGWLNISGTKVSDISVLKRMPLSGLFMTRCYFIKDFSPLKRLKNLEDLLLPFQATKMKKEIRFLKKLKNLKHIDIRWHEKQQSAEAFFEKYGI